MNDRLIHQSGHLFLRRFSGAPPIYSLAKTESIGEKSGFHFLAKSAVAREVTKMASRAEGGDARTIERKISLMLLQS
jgi:hypothetical protein